MKTTLLLLAMCMAFVASCPPPRYRRRFVTNDTAPADVQDLEAIGPATGWIHDIGGGSEAKPWPRGKDGIVRITYCFKDQKSREKLAVHIAKALIAWSSVLGAPSKQHGHAIAKPTELVKDGKPKLCRNGDHWDAAIPNDTFEIYATDADIPGAETIAGYYDEEPGKPEPGRHNAQFGMNGFLENTNMEDSDEEVTEMDIMEGTFLHEMGHMFGLEHEHQRSDRDLHVKFRCEVLGDYERVKKDVEAKGHHKIEDVCNDEALALEYQFSAHAYAKIFDTSGSHHGILETMSKTFDVESAMIYDSWAGTKLYEEGATPDFDEWPLVKWNHPYDSADKVPKEATRENSIEINPRRRPSMLDREALRELYPWKD